MDIDIGNILYIVITIVAVAVGLLGKKKKPGQGAAATPEGIVRPGFMENLERVLRMGQEEPRDVYLEPYEEELQVEEVVVVEKPNEIKKSGSLIEEYNRIMNRRTDGEMELVNSEGESTTEAMELVDLDYVQGTDYFELIENFDGGKAIVYSSIINRLDY
ncbi:MAG: hypothetical protein E4H16_05140 [Candidatus Atribacteria bacterium]|nr:MAG: hypothetical protein E4H16_05140 [Candidatus Atribacteria bacterium]